MENSENQKERIHLRERCKLIDSSLVLHRGPIDGKTDDDDGEVIGAFEMHFTFSDARNLFIEEMIVLTAANLRFSLQSPHQLILHPSIKISHVAQNVCKVFLPRE